MEDLIKKLFENRKEQINTLEQKTNEIVSICVDDLCLCLEEDSKAKCNEFQNWNVISGFVNIENVICKVFEVDITLVDKDNFINYCNKIVKQVMHEMKELNFFSRDNYNVTYIKEREPVGLTVRIQNI